MTDVERRDRLRAELQRLNPLREPERYGALFDEFAALEGRLRRSGEPDGPKGPDSTLGRREVDPAPSSPGRDSGDDTASPGPIPQHL